MDFNSEMVLMRSEVTFRTATEDGKNSIGIHARLLHRDPAATAGRLGQLAAQAPDAGQHRLDP
jgi:hypothetical protein